MLQKIKITLLSLTTIFIMATPLALPAAVSAQSQDTGNATIQGSVCGGAKNLTITEQNQSGTCTDTTQTNKVNDLIRQIINVLSVIVGIVAVIMIIVGGFRYITSGGSSEKVTSAKNTILYAIIGLIVVALAQIIVRFTLNKITNS